MSGEVAIYWRKNYLVMSKLLELGDGDESMGVT